MTIEDARKIVRDYTAGTGSRQPSMSEFLAAEKFLRAAAK